MSKRAKKLKSRVSAERRLKEHKSGFDSLAIRMPSKATMFSPKNEGTYKLDVIPYTTGKGNPFAKKGALYYERTYFTHRGIGPNQEAVICAAKTFKKPCYVCEYRAKLGSDPDRDKDTEQVLKNLLFKERQLFNVFDHKEKKKGVQVWEISFHLFGKHLDKKIDLAHSPAEKKARRLFADPQVGRTLYVGASEETMGKNKFLDFSDIEFKKRAEPLSSKLLKQAVCLDDLIPEPDYDEIKKLFLQGMGGGKKKRKGEDEEEEDEDDEEEEDEEEDEDEEDEDEDEDSDEEEDEDEDEEDDEPRKKSKSEKKKKKSKKGKKGKDDEDEEDEDEDEDGDDEPWDEESDDEDEEEDEDEDEDGEDEPRRKKKPKKGKKKR